MPVIVVDKPRCMVVPPYTAQCCNKTVVHEHMSSESRARLAHVAAVVARGVGLIPIEAWSMKRRVVVIGAVQVHQSTPDTVQQRNRSSLRISLTMMTPSVSAS